MTSEQGRRSRAELPALTSEQTALKLRIETALDTVSAIEYDQFVLERKRDDFAISCRDLLGALLDPTRSYQTLEVGAGTGIVTARLRELDQLVVTALDVRSDFLQLGIEHGRMLADEAVVGDFEQLPFPDDSFDLYTGVAIMNQRRDIDRFYAEALRVLRQDGLLFMPWVKVKTDSIEREKALFQHHHIRVVKEGDWFLLGQKQMS